MTESKAVRRRPRNHFFREKKREGERGRERERGREGERKK
jgi:hypothetical protein